MPADAVVQTLGHVWKTLEGLSVPMALIGGLSLASWKHIRSTQDVDLLIGIADVRLHAVLARLHAAGFRSKGRTPVVRVDENEFIQLLYEPPGLFLEIQVDLLFADTEFQRQALARRVPLAFHELGFDVAVIACEDLIVMKLLAGRMIDRADVSALLRANRDRIAWEHLSNWIDRFGLKALFRESWSDAFPADPSPI
jgi:hypothetical protein